MLKKNFSLAFLLVSILLPGCSYTYLQPKSNEPSAELLLWSATRLTVSGNSFYAFDQESCKSHNSVSPIANFYESQQNKSINIWPNKPIYILANMHHVYSQNQFAKEVYYCQNLISFTPEVDHKYDIRHRPSSGKEKCFIKIIDTSTNTEPPSLKIYSLDGNEFCNIIKNDKQ